jgi:hypothetical protein
MGSKKMNMDAFRAQLMQAASIHGGIAPQMLTQKSIDKTEKDIASNAHLNKIIDDAIKAGSVKADDELFKFLKNLFIVQAETLDGQERALKMAIYTTFKINQEFKVEKR